MPAIASRLRYDSGSSSKRVAIIVFVDSTKYTVNVKVAIWSAGVVFRKELGTI